MQMENQQEDEIKKKSMCKNNQRELGISCMLNTEIGAILAIIRRPPDSQFYLSDDHFECSVLPSLKSLRTLIFNPQQEWRCIDPTVYLSPFLDVIQSYDVPASATGVALSSILKILRLEIFDQKTPGVREILNATVTAITSCRLEKTDPVTEDAIMMRILQLLVAIMKHKAHVMLSDHAVCTVVNTCFQVVQQSSNRGGLLQRSARHTMQELIHIIYNRLPEIEVADCENSESDSEDTNFDSGFGIYSAVDIFQFLCSLLNVVHIGPEVDGYASQVADLDVQIFALVLINSAIELSGDSIGKHPKLLRMIQDDLFHHLIHYGTHNNPLVLSMICSTVLNIYHFLRRSVRLQLEAFFSFVLLRAANLANAQLQEVAIEAIVNFCRQSTFTVEVYVNYDCSPFFRNVFEELAKLICKNAFPSGGLLTSLQLQAFEGLSIIIHNIADNIDKEDDSSPSRPYPVEITDYKTQFWEDKSKNDDLEEWINFLRIRKVQKTKLLISGNHFNQDVKKGLQYLEISGLVSDPPDPKAYAVFLRCTPGLDKTLIGEYLGDPDEFHIEVLREFANTFEFSGMLLDSALRCFLESFRLPGESQKIHRIIETFSERFYDQRSSEMFVSKDAVFVFSYSLIMLNTDQHNPQVKKKMTEEDFIKNNRSINGGKDLPRGYLSELFNSIAASAIATFDPPGVHIEMSPYRWVHLVNQSKIMNPFVLCAFDRRLGRDMFAAISGPSLATIAAVFEHSDEEDIIHECVEALFSIAKIAQHQLEDTLDELICLFCKFTTLLNPHASMDETLYAFSNDIKPRMATLAVFTIANVFKESIRGSWGNIIDCLLKLRKLKLLPASTFDPDTLALSSKPKQENPELGMVSKIQDLQVGSSRRRGNGLVGRFSEFLSMKSVEESLNHGVSDFEHNVKIIQQCRIETIFSDSSSLPEVSLLNLGRAIIFAAGGKGQNFSTSIDEEDIVALCWDLIVIISNANIHRFSSFWPQYNEYLNAVTQFTPFSAIPYAEKAMVAQMKICLKLLSTSQSEKNVDEFIFKSINSMWKMEKEIIDTCSDFLLHSVHKILTEYPANLQSSLGWKSVMHLLSVTGRHPESYDQGVEALISLMSNAYVISRTNYAFCIDCAFNFIALKNSPVEINMKIMDLMSDSVKLLVQWYRNEYTDSDSSVSFASNASTLSVDDLKAPSSSTYIMNLFLKVGEVFKKTCLARREEIRNHSILSLKRSILFAEELCFSPHNCVRCFKTVIFAMVDDIHEKMVEYSRRDNAEKETRSMQGSRKIALGVMTELYLLLLKPLSESSCFKSLWMRLLRRMDTFLKEVDLRDYDKTDMEDLVKNIFKKMIDSMKKNDMLVPKEGDDFWEKTRVHIEWIAPSLVEELFPECVNTS